MMELKGLERFLMRCEGGDMIQLIHRDVKIVGQCWDLDDVNGLEDLRKSIIEAAERWAQPFSDEKVATSHGLESERDKECRWYEGACFEIWGEFFVKYFGNLSVVDLDREKYNPNPKVKDFGVDGWGFNNSGDSATTQFKFRSDSNFRIQYKEISNFKDQSREDYGVFDNKNMVVITTAFGFNEEATCQARGVRCLGWDQLKAIIEIPSPNPKFWQDFRESVVASSRLAKREYKVPFPHQYLMYRKIRDYGQNRGYVLCGTGGGKTLTMCMYSQWHLSQDGQQIIVIASPRIQLSNQIAKMFWDEKSVDWEWLTFHSGSPAEIAIYNDAVFCEESTIEQEEQEICRMGGASTLDLDKVVRFIRENSQDKIVYTTYHSSEKLLKRLNEKGIDFVYIGDECHNLVSPQFSRVLDKDIVSIPKFIGFTATIETTTDPNDVGMNNHSRWGKCIIEITPAHLVSMGITIPPRMYFAEINALGSEEGVEIEATGQIIKKFKEEVCPNSPCRVIVSCTSCQVAQYLADSDVLDKYIPKFKRCLVISYKNQMGARTRETEIEKFQSATDAVVFHYSMLGEGIDVPGVVAVLAWRDLSVRDGVQLVGRASRIVENDRKALSEKKIVIGNDEGWEKPYAYILCPRQEGNQDLITAYNNMIRIINRLRDKKRNISCYVHGAESKGSIKPSPFPLEKGIEEADIDQILASLESKEEAERIYYNESMGELLKRIEDSLTEEGQEQQARKDRQAKLSASSSVVLEGLTKEEIGFLAEEIEKDEELAKRARL